MKYNNIILITLFLSINTYAQSFNCPIKSRFGGVDEAIKINLDTEVGIVEFRKVPVGSDLLIKIIKSLKDQNSLIEQHLETPGLDESGRKVFRDIFDQNLLNIAKEEEKLNGELIGASSKMISSSNDGSSLIFVSESSKLINLASIIVNHNTNSIEISLSLSEESLEVQFLLDGSISQLRKLSCNKI